MRSPHKSILHIWLLIFLCVSVTDVFAQDSSVQSCALSRQQHFRTLNKTTVASLSEEDYDVKYVKLDVELTNTNNGISGSGLTKAVARVAMNQYVFELDSVAFIDSVKINGSACSVSASGIIRTATIGATIPSGVSFTAQVWYRKSPDTLYDGIISARSQTGYPFWSTYTLSEPYSTFRWWPCKQSLQDKIDSSDVWITVDSSLKAGSNGLLENITSLPGTRNRYEWKNRYLISYYLISLAVARYRDYSYYVHFPNSTDSMLVQNYVYHDTGYFNTQKPYIDTVGQIITYFSDIFGRYPFWKEKYGHCTASIGGGMEHQTMSTMEYFYIGLSAHELAHQWFGDYVTCGTWRDIWLNEGFATYASHLYWEHLRGTVAAMQDIADLHNQSDPDTVYLNPIDTTSLSSIFNTGVVYNKGASILHTLRYLAPSDSVFFASLRAYLQHFAFGTATTQDFQTTIQPFYTRNLDTFFNEWVYGWGYPIYRARWNTINGNLYINITQRNFVLPGPPPIFPTTVFHIPLELKISGAQGDTTVVIEMQNLSENISFPWNRPVDTVIIDPNDWILDKNLGVVRDTSLSITQVAEQKKWTVLPNPSHDAWHIEGNPVGAWQLTDISGRLLSEGKSAEVPAANLPSGVYLLRLKGENGTAQTVRLLRD